jgi:hypothetical protein
MVKCDQIVSWRLSSVELISNIIMPYLLFHANHLHRNIYIYIYRHTNEASNSNLIYIYI